MLLLGVLASLQVLLHHLKDHTLPTKATLQIGVALVDLAHRLHGSSGVFLPSPAPLAGDPHPYSWSPLLDFSLVSMSEVEELEAELMKRNREIAQVRDQLNKMTQKHDDVRDRNDDLLSKTADLDAEVTKKTNQVDELEVKVVELKEEVKTKEVEIEQVRQEVSNSADTAAKEAAIKEETRAQAETEIKAIQEKLEEAEKKAGGHAGRAPRGD